MHKAILSPCAAFFLALFTASAHAGGSGSTTEGQQHAPAALPGNDENASAPGLEQRLTPQESEELYRDLQNQSEAAYADHAQIESRRQIMRKKLEERLQQADTDNDNSISRLEAEESMPGLAKHFDQIDINHDGVITLDEMKAADERNRELRERQANSGRKPATQVSNGKKSVKKHKKGKRPRKTEARKTRRPAEIGT